MHALILATLITPAFASAKTIFSVLDNVSSLLNGILGLLITLAIVVFFWGLVKYIAQAGNPQAKSEGLRLITYGIISIFVMVSIWGIIALLQNTVGIDGSEVGVPNDVVPSPLPPR